MRIRSYIAVVLLAFATVACKQKPGTASDHFEVIVSYERMGTFIGTVKANQDSISIMDSEKKVSFSRALTSMEKGELSGYLGKLNLKNFKPKYVNPEVKDGTQLTFDITVEKEHINVYVSNFYVEELGKLVRIINSLIQADPIIYSEEI